MKKIIIFSSRGGGGHISVSNALTKYLQTQYEIQEVYLFATVFKRWDPIQFLSFNITTGEDLYNRFVQKKWFRLLNFYSKIGHLYFKIAKIKIRSLIKNYLKQEQPNLIISVVPFVNDSILHATQELNIPFLLIPTDLDARTFITGIKSPDFSKFKISAPFDDPEIKQTYAQAAINDAYFHISGFPLRPDFFEEKNNNEIKRQLNIPEHKAVILVLMGALGSKETLIYAKKLAKLKSPAHLIICLGRNTSLRSHIEKIKFPAHISVSIFGFYERMSDLFAITDLFITKSGSVSVSEGLYMNTPLLLDGTSSVLQWERFNHRFIKKHKMGLIIEKYKDITKLIDQLLTNRFILKQFQENIQSFQKKNPMIEVPALIQSMLFNK